MNKPRILIFGNNNLAVECLDFLFKSKENIAAVVPEPGDSGSDTWQKSFRKRAKELKVRILDTSNINESSFLSLIRKEDIDYIFSFQCRTIMKRDLVAIPKYGCINLHFSPLPRYRGCAPISWAISNGEKEYGVTLHYINEGVDSGDVIVGKRFTIGESTTAGELYDLCTLNGIALFKEYYLQIISGSISRIPQLDSEALYYPKNSFNFKDIEVDWSKDAGELFNWIRALIFPPLQLPFFHINSERIEIMQVELIRDGLTGQTSSIGSIAAVNNQGFAMAALRGRILIKEAKINFQIQRGLQLVKLVVQK